MLAGKEFRVGGKSLFVQEEGVIGNIKKGGSLVESTTHCGSEAPCVNLEGLSLREGLPGE